MAKEPQINIINLSRIVRIINEIHCNPTNCIPTNRSFTVLLSEQKHFQIVNLT
jgi:hypothetical protein